MPGKNWKVQTRLLVREGVLHQQTRNCLKIIKERMGKIGCGSQMGARHPDGLAEGAFLKQQLNVILGQNCSQF
jgi:hypothetical protein